jgi:small subunit ribosomal protein S6
MSAAEKLEKPRYREWETIYVMRSSVTAEAAAKVATRMEDVVAREGARLTLVENWGRRLLAYVVKGNTRGVYVYFKYVGFGEVVAEIERNLRMFDEVIKFQSVLVNPEVEVEAVAVDPEVVKFEEVRPPEPDEVEPTLAQTLGLDGVDLRARRVDTSAEDDLDEMDQEDDDL